MTVVSEEVKTEGGECKGSECEKSVSGVEVEVEGTGRKTWCSRASWLTKPTKRMDVALASFPYEAGTGSAEGG